MKEQLRPDLRDFPGKESNYHGILLLPDPGYSSMKDAHILFQEMFQERLSSQILRKEEI